METNKLTQRRLLYNPQLQNAEMTEKTFAVRQAQFALLLNNIVNETENSIPQHHIIIGQRGMGKTMMLKRMEAELHKEQYRRQFIPLFFRVEQNNVKKLAKFWLNALDALADSLESEDAPTELLTEIDKTITELSKKALEEVADEAYRYLMNTCRELHRRPVLLIDNIDIVFNRLGNRDESKREQWALRRLLSENGAPVVIGTSVTTTNDFVAYKMPFYDFFNIQFLQKLSAEEFSTLLHNLATVTNSDTTVFQTIQQTASRQKTLLELTNGTPRVAVKLFEQLSNGSSDDITTNLNMLIDFMTPHYKAEIEKLPTQQQIILHAIALHWDAISLRELSIATGMKNNLLSPQLKRLIDDGWVETTPACQDKGNAYFISDRFFNTYCLIRCGNRQHRNRIYGLARFLERFYESETAEKPVNHMCNEYKIEDDLSFTMVFESSQVWKEIEQSEQEDSDNKPNVWLTTNQDWWLRIGSMVIKSGYGSWLLEMLEKKGYDVVLSPYYTAIQAIEIERKNSKKDKRGKTEAEIYLNSRAVEIGKPAKMIMEKIRKYMN